MSGTTYSQSTLPNGTICHSQSSNQVYLHNGAKSINWPMNSNNTNDSMVVGANLNQLNSKNYCIASNVGNNEVTTPTPIDSDTTFFHQQQKDSENVKRFSVNNLLRLAKNGSSSSTNTTTNNYNSNCRVLSNDRLTGTEFVIKLCFWALVRDVDYYYWTRNKLT